MSFNKSVSKNFIIYIFFTIIFLVLNEIYYIFFIEESSTNNLENFTYANYHDHSIYEIYIRYIYEGNNLLVFGNNYGIASIYYIIGEIFESNNYILLSHYVNQMIFIFISLSTYKLFMALRINLLFSIFITFNPANFYFLSLINKDSFTILLILLFVYNIYKQNYVTLFILIIISTIIRIQLPLFGLVLLFLLDYKKISLVYKILFLYIVSCTLSVILVNNIELISLDNMNTSLGFGITKITKELNQNYYIGSFLLNPIKIFQYFYDYLNGFTYIYDFSKFDLYREKDILNLFFLPFSIILLLFTFLCKRKVHEISKVFLLIIVAFFIVWLINPTINYRYLSLFVPYIIIAGIYTLNIRINNEK